MEKKERLDKILSNKGLGTRREVKSFIKKGKVTINGNIVKDEGFKVSSNDEIVYDNKKLTKEKFIYYLLNKPSGVITATEDREQKTVMAFIDDKNKGLFPVGRLDKDTEGLLLITNNGELAHRLLSPKKHVSKVYYLISSKALVNDYVEKLKEGLDIGDEKKTLPAKAYDYNKINKGYELKLEITEGRFHQVKRMIKVLGGEVIYLKRLSLGSLVLPDNLETGKYIKLSEEYINKIF